MNFSFYTISLSQIGDLIQERVKTNMNHMNATVVNVAITNVATFTTVAFI